MEGNSAERDMLLTVVKGRLRSTRSEQEDALVKIEEVVSSAKCERGRPFREACEKARPLAVNVAARSLRNSIGDVDVAAEKNLEYWKCRYDLFGREHVHKLMTATENGALTRNDIEVLKSGFLVVLPATTCGKPVLCFDRYRLNEDFHDLSEILESVKRCIFYMTDALSLIEESRSNGCVLLELYHSNHEILPTDESISALLDSLLQDILPIKLSRCEVVMMPPRTQRYEFMEAVIPQIQSNLTRRFKDIDFGVHVNSSRNKLLELLEGKGFSKKGLPSSVGGSWGYRNQFDIWLKEQLVEEKIIEAMYTTTEKEIPMSGLLKAVSIVRDDEARQRKRIQDKHYARRKRQKRKGDEDNLKGDIGRLQQEQSVLLKRQRALQQLLHSAIQTARIVDQQQVSESAQMVQALTGFSQHPSLNNISWPIDYTVPPLETLLLSRLRQQHFSQFSPLASSFRSTANPGLDFVTGAGVHVGPIPSITQSSLESNVSGLQQLLGRAASAPVASPSTMQGSLLQYPQQNSALPPQNIQFNQSLNLTQWQPSQQPLHREYSQAEEFKDAAHKSN